MSHVSAVKRWIAGLSVVGTIAGALLALTSHPARAESATSDKGLQGGSGCKCTISGTGKYTCLLPSSCTTGSFTCQASCKT